MCQSVARRPDTSWVDKIVATLSHFPLAVDSSVGVWQAVSHSHSITMSLIENMISHCEWLAWVCLSVSIESAGMCDNTAPSDHHTSLHCLAGLVAHVLAIMISTSVSWAKRSKLGRRHNDCCVLCVWAQWTTLHCALMTNNGHLSNFSARSFGYLVRLKLQIK